MSDSRAITKILYWVSVVVVVAATVILIGVLFEPPTSYIVSFIAGMVAVVLHKLADYDGL
jgi:F0F1-type ATP synthase assembly protein I